jgi:protein-disulfide isomerase
MRLQLTLAAALALAVVGCTSKQDSASLDDRIHAYLLRHPEVVEEAYNKAQEQKQARAEADAEKTLLSHKADLENDPRDFVANPKGKITVVEFFDYRCPYCKAALPALMDLIQKNPDIRFVFKEFPILPDADGKVGISKRAAEAAIAAQAAGKYLKVHDALMSAKPLDDVGIDNTLTANGIDKAKALAPSAAIDKRLQDIHDLALSIGVTGTPSFVVGDKTVPGADMEGLEAAIDLARKQDKG